MQKPDHTDVECWKCGQKRHIQKNCHSKKKKKEGSSKDKDTANTATGGDKFAFTTTFIGAVLTCNSNPLAKLETNVYDSGASSHMSPAHDCFTSFTMVTRLENIQVGKGQYLYKTGRRIWGTKSTNLINRSGMLGHVHRLVKGEQSDKDNKRVMEEGHRIKET